MPKKIVLELTEEQLAAVLRLGVWTDPETAFVAPESDDYPLLLAVGEKLKDAQ